MRPRNVLDSHRDLPAEVPVDQPSVIPRLRMAGAGEAAPAGSSDLHIFIRMAAAAGCSLCQFAQSWSSHCPELMGAGLSQPTSRDLQLSLLSPHLSTSLTAQTPQGHTAALPHPSAAQMWLQCIPAWPCAPVLVRGL